MKWFGLVILSCAACAFGTSAVDRDEVRFDGTCGGPSNQECPAGEWCDFVTNDCGATEPTGYCQPLPTCGNRFELTCGCDGRVHYNRCDAEASGFDTTVGDRCLPEPGYFFCGAKVQCKIASEFCSHQAGSPFIERDNFYCSPLPASCNGIPSIECVTISGPCLCSGDATSGITRTCGV